MIQEPKFNLGDRVRLKCGRFKGWCGTICEQRLTMYGKDIEVYYSVKTDCELPDDDKKVTIIRELQDILEGISASDIEQVATINELKEWRDYFTKNKIVKKGWDERYDYIVDTLPESIRLVIYNALQKEIDTIEKG